MKDQVVDVHAHVPGELLEVDGLVRVVLAAGGVEERAQRHLGVHEDVLAVGEVDPHVGARRLPVGLGGDLEVEVAALDHAREARDVLERRLAPRAADLRLSQRVDQGGRLAAHGLDEAP